MQYLKSHTSYSEMGKLLSQHMPALDGIRGLAILMVVLHNVVPHGVEHADIFLIKLILQVCDAGWVGVELFFVLSGFLITGILLDGKKSEHQLRNFYIRRSLRIFPLYYAFLIIIFIILPLVSMSPGWLEYTKQYEIWYWLYMINWVQPYNSQIELGHFWSLAIEEQFYLLWPLLVINVPRKILGYVCFVLVVSAIVFRFVFVNYLPDAGAAVAYTFTVARYDALAIGALIALVCRNHVWFDYVEARSFGIVFIVLSIMLGSILVNHEFAPAEGFMGGLNQTLAAILFGLFIFLSLVANKNKSSINYRILSSKILTLAGKYSYAIYIFHVPVKFIWFSHYSLDSMEFEGSLKLLAMMYNFFGVFMISTGMALISWRLLERPCLGYKRMFVKTA